MNGGGGHEAGVVEAVREPLRKAGFDLEEAPGAVADSHVVAARGESGLACEVLVAFRNGRVGRVARVSAWMEGAGTRQSDFLAGEPDAVRQWIRDVIGPAANSGNRKGAFMQQETLPMDISRTQDAPGELERAAAAQPSDRRPRRGDDYVRRAAAAAILPELRRWLGDDSDQFDDETLIGDLMKVAHEIDGYRAARALEDQGWGADSELVDILDGFSFRVDLARRSAVKAWLDRHGIEPEFDVGDRVVTRKHDPGVIRDIRREDGTYVVGTARFADEKGGEIHDWETVSAARGQEGGS